jgi:hypothetical protein
LISSNFANRSDHAMLTYTHRLTCMRSCISGDPEFFLSFFVY